VSEVSEVSDVSEISEEKQYTPPSAPPPAFGGVWDCCYGLGLIAAISDLREKISMLPLISERLGTAVEPL
jgi:hypothetical protein